MKFQTCWRSHSQPEGHTVSLTLEPRQKHYIRYSNQNIFLSLKLSVRLDKYYFSLFVIISINFQRLKDTMITEEIFILKYFLSLQK